MVDLFGKLQDKNILDNFKRIKGMAKGLLNGRMEESM